MYNFNHVMCEHLRGEKIQLNYKIPQEYKISSENFIADSWKYQLVIHKEFDNTDIPEKWDEKLLSQIPNKNENLKVFALKNEEYCAHCGLWYTESDTTYIEPVVTIPEHRKQGLAKAVIYEACNRAKKIWSKESNRSF